MSADPVMVGRTRSRLISVAREMSERLQRSAYSPMIRETLDFCSAIHDTRGNVIAQATGIPGLFGLMSHSVAAVLERFGIEGLRPGDVIVCNDPYVGGGLHLNDVNVIAPIFWRGEPVAIAQSKAHWVDIGSIEPGGWSPDATDHQQEGLRMPPVKLVSEGRWNEGVRDVIAANVRLPVDIGGDLTAQVGSVRAAEPLIVEIFESAGSAAVVEECVEEILDQADRALRAEIAALPDGVYRAVDMADPEVGGDGPIRVEVAVEVAGDRLRVDFDGTDPQGRTSFGNCSLPGTEAFARLAVKSMLDPRGPTNEGSYRAIEVSAPLGSCVNPELPAPCTVGPANVGHVVLENVMKALAQAAPERGLGDQFGSVQVLVVSGPSEGEEPFILFTSGYGGSGARAAKDGLNGVATQLDGNVRNMPVEVMESNLPIRVERFELRPDSGGPGRQRGGLGARADFRLLAPRADGSIALNRAAVEPSGLFGGESPQLSRMLIEPGAEDERRLDRGAFQLRSGMVVSHQIGGGAGYGDPSQRDPGAVAADVREGYVSAAAARERYRVALGPQGEPDAAETARLRAPAEQPQPSGSAAP